MTRDWDIGFGRRMFESIDKDFAEAEEMLNRMFRTIRETSPSDMVVQGPYYYGYQITVGPRGLVEQSGVREPLVDTAIDEKENTLTITAEMPGVTKQDIKVNVGEEYVSIHAEKGEKKYHTDIPINVTLDDTSAKATYANGILELKIKLKAPPKPKAKEVKVE